MFLFIYIGVIMGVYVYTFADDFSKEHIDKVTPFVIITTLLLIIIGILGSLVGGR